MISLGDEAISINEALSNYDQVSDCPIPHIQQVREMYKLCKYLQFTGFQLGLWIGVCSNDLARLRI